MVEPVETTAATQSVSVKSEEALGINPIPQGLPRLSMLDKMIEEENPNLLELDFSKVQFMDSSGIGLIMGRYKLMHAIEGDLKVINIPLK